MEYLPDKNIVLLRRLEWESSFWVRRGHPEHFHHLELTYLSIGDVDVEVVDHVTQFYRRPFLLKPLGALMTEAAAECGLRLRLNPEHPFDYLWQSYGAWDLDRYGQEPDIDYNLRHLVPNSSRCVRALRLYGWDERFGRFTRFDRDITWETEIPAVFVDTSNTPFRIEVGTFWWPLSGSPGGWDSLPNSLGILGLRGADVYSPIAPESLALYA